MCDHRGGDSTVINILLILKVISCSKVCWFSKHPSTLFPVYWVPSYSVPWFTKEFPFPNKLCQGSIYFARLCKVFFCGCQRPTHGCWVFPEKRPTFFAKITYNCTVAVQYRRHTMSHMNHELSRIKQMN